MAVSMRRRPERRWLVRTDYGNLTLRRNESDLETYALERWGLDGFWTTSEQLAEDVKLAWNRGHDVGRVTTLEFCLSKVDQLRAYLTPRKD